MLIFYQRKLCGKKLKTTEFQNLEIGNNYGHKNLELGTFWGSPSSLEIFSGFHFKLGKFGDSLIGSKIFCRKNGKPFLIRRKRLKSILDLVRQYIN